MNARLLALVLAFGWVARVRAQEAPRPRVEAVLTATGAVHDLAFQPAGPARPSRLLLATDGGLVVRGDRRGRPSETLAAGLPGVRLRSVSLVGRDLWVGGVEGTARLAAEPLEVQERRPVRLADESAERISLGRSHARRRMTDALVVRVGDRAELWVATAGAGILRVGEDARLLGRLTRRSGLPDDHVFDLALDGTRLLAATMNGLASVDVGERARPAALRLRADPAIAQLPLRDVRAVAPAGESTFVAVYGDGLHRLEGGRARRVGASGLRPVSLAVTGDGVVAGFADGLRRVAGDRLERLHGGGLPSADVTSLARAFGRVWVGSFSGGLASVRAGAARAETRASERFHVDGRVNDLAVTRAGGQRLWIATDRGLFTFDGRIFTRVEDPAAPGPVHVTSLHVDAEGGLWVTSSRVLAHRTPDGRWRGWGGDERFPVMNLHAVTTDADGRVWIGSLHGLFAFDPREGPGARFARYTVASGALPVDWVTALTTFGGRVIAGTYHGGLAWARRDGEGLVSERPGAALPAGWVNPHALRVIAGQVWVGTQERGLLVGRRGAWQQLTTADGLPSDDVTDVLPDGDGVWVATRGGLARVVPGG